MSERSTDAVQIEYQPIPSGGEVNFDLSAGPINFRLGGNDYLQIVVPNRDLDDTTARRINPDVSALIISPEDLDIASNKGYKGLWQGTEVTLGRNHKGRIEFSDTVSRDHARIVLDGETVTITDLGSTNHTFIGKQLLRNTVQTVPETIVNDTPVENKGSIERLGLQFGGATAPSERYHDGHNDDAWFSDPGHMSLGVFDGVGGAPGSDMASRIAAESVQRSLAKPPSDVMPQSLAGMYMGEALKDAHKAIVEQSGNYIQTTATIAKVFEDESGIPYVSIAYAGDSRAYLLRNDELKMLTLDHGLRVSNNDDEQFRAQETLAQVVNPATLDQQLGTAFRNRNQIISALGGRLNDELLVGVINEELLPGDKLILTTDGIHDNLTTDEIQHWVCRQGNGTILARRLVQAAQERARLPREMHARAKMDDMTAVIMDVKI